MSASKWFLGVAVITAVLSGFLLFQSQIYRLHFKEEVPESLVKELSALGEQSLASLDVPVGAVLQYRGVTIGRGYNTVNKDGDAMGHAEVNAIREAYRRFPQWWNKLNREDLVLYSTFEPCPMCKGAMSAYGIRRIVFERSKPFGESMRESLSTLRLNLNAKQMDVPGLQESLFVKHPGYRKGE